MTDDQPVEPEVPLSETQLCVKYTGDSHFRILSVSDLRGEKTDEDGALVWTPGQETPYELFLMFAGSHERAVEVLSKHSHEFSIVGPGAEDYYASLEVEEFSIEVPAED